MPSSTSSSDERRPKGPWLRTWLLAVALAVIALAGWEACWRAYGFRPSVPDESAAWSIVRSQVGRGSVVSVGTSRIQTDLDPRAWADVWGGSVPRQLAIAGTSPLPVLEDLAADSTFAGLVLFDFIPVVVFEATGAWKATAREWLDDHRLRSRSPSRRIEARLSTWVQSRLALRNPALAPRTLLARLADGELPRVPYWTLDRYRFERIDFTRTDTVRRAAAIARDVRREGRQATTAEMDAIFDRLETAVRAIQQRGGRVVFLLLPRSGVVREAEEARCPRSACWDAFVTRTSGLTLNTEDDAVMGTFVCPDGSHLDMRDAAAFTRRLAAALLDEL
ncbi:MAG TPA: hypothetical protein VLC48_11585 [Gemmatimonadota bacterium]|nr:hypothetical protein [Gemmatimonadota bacterium]